MKFKKMFKELNVKQKEVVMHILNCFELNKEPFRIFLSGSASVRKSSVIKTVYHVITDYFDSLPGGDLDNTVWITFSNRTTN